MKLSDITAKTPLVKDFVSQLAKATKQAIPIVEVGKLSRVMGATACPVDMVLENGQTVKIYLRMADDHFDIFRIDVNGKNQPLAGDYDNSYRPSFNASVNALGNMLRTGQAAFDKKRAKMKIRKPSTGPAPKNKIQQLSAMQSHASDLDAIIEQRTKEKSSLEAQIASHQSTQAAL